MLIKPRGLCALQIHDTSRGAVRSSEFQSVLNVLEFSHPMAANVLIDKVAIERILLIPDDVTCQSLLSRVATVPRNCNFAITLKRDTYYPAPTYRTYAAHGRQNNVRYLKASKEAILQLSVHMTRSRPQPGKRPSL